MTVLNKLATSLGRRDEVPNEDLAQEIAGSKNAGAVKELIENLTSTDNNIANDCIKVLYEVGERNPKLIMGYTKEFGALLGSNNNRLVWGSMTALDAVARFNPNGVHDLMREILTAAEGESVIARDHAVGILVKLASVREYRSEALAALLGQLRGSPVNQLPMYAEMSEQAFQETHKKDFSKVLRARSKEFKKESQKKRIDKVLKRLS